MIQNNVRFAIMGAGRIAGRFCEAVNLVDGAQLAFVASKDSGRAGTLAEKYKAEAYGSYEEMLSRKDIDVVYIATTHNFHRENIESCLNNGKGVICEKSMCVCSADAREMFALAKEKNLFLMEAMWARFLPAVQKAKEWLDSGEIGEPVMGSAVIGFKAKDDLEDRFLNKALGGGAAFDLTVYSAEISTYLLGTDYKSFTAKAVFGKTGVDIINNVTLDYGTHIMNIQSTLAASQREEKLILSGTLGSIILGKLAGANTCTLYRDGSEPLTFKGEYGNGFVYEVEEVVRCIKNGSTTSSVVEPNATIKCAELYDALLNPEL